MVREKRFHSGMNVLSAVSASYLNSLEDRLLKLEHLTVADSSPLVMSETPGGKVIGLPENIVDIRLARLDGTLTERGSGAGEGEGTANLVAKKVDKNLGEAGFLEDTDKSVDITNIITSEIADDSFGFIITLQQSEEKTNLWLPLNIGTGTVTGDQDPFDSFQDNKLIKGHAPSGTSNTIQDSTITLEDDGDVGIFKDISFSGDLITSASDTQAIIRHGIDLTFDSIIDSSLPQSIVPRWNFSASEGLGIPNVSGPIGVKGIISYREVTNVSIGTSSGHIILHGLLAGGADSDLLIPTINLANFNAAEAKQALTLNNSGQIVWTNVASNAANLANNNLVLGDGGAGGVKTSGIVIDGDNSITGVGSITSFIATNDANPEHVIGSSSAEQLSIKAIYDGGAQTLSHVLYATTVVSGTSNKGLHRFNVDGIDILDIDDAGVDIGNGKSYSINNTSVLNSTTLGSSVVNSSLTKVGTITNGTWQATDVGITHGGTGASSASSARTNLELAIGSNIQAWDVFLDDISDLVNPGADRGLFWDNSAGKIVFFTFGAGLAMTDTTLDVTSGAGDVTASANLTDNAIIRGDGGVKGVQDSSVLISDTNVITGGTWEGIDIGVAHGGTGSSTATGARSNLGTAPNDAKYIVQTSDSELSAEQALGALSTGILKNTTTTGVLSIAIVGTDYQAPITTLFTFRDDVGTTIGVDLNTIFDVSGSGSATLTLSGTDLIAGIKDDFLLNTGDTGTGIFDFGGATSLEIPNSATKNVSVNGQVAIDTAVANWSHGLFKYFSGEEMAVVAMPIAQFTSPTDGFVPAYNAANDEFELVAQSLSIIWGDGLQESAGTASVDFNTTNLKITATELNTIQDIATSSSPTFAAITVGTLTIDGGNETIRTGNTLTDQILFSAYDGAVYQIFMTLTAAATPSLAISGAAGTLTIQAATLSSITGTGNHDYRTASYFAVPTSTNPVSGITGSIALDTSVTGHTDGLLEYLVGANVFFIPGLPIAEANPADLTVVRYNASSNDYEMDLVNDLREADLARCLLNGALLAVDATAAVDGIVYIGGTGSDTSKTVQNTYNLLGSNNNQGVIMKDGGGVWHLLQCDQIT